MTRSALILAIAGCTSGSGVPFETPATPAEVCLTHDPSARFVVEGDPVLIEQTALTWEMVLTLEFTAMGGGCVALRDGVWSTASGSASGFFAETGCSACDKACGPVDHECSATDQMTFTVPVSESLRGELEETGLVLDQTLSGNAGRTVDIHQVIPVLLLCKPGMTGCE